MSERPRNVAEDVIHNSSLFSQSWFTGGIHLLAVFASWLDDPSTFAVFDLPVGVSAMFAKLC